MASHLVIQRRSLREVGLISDIPPTLIRNTYQVMYRSREHIVREDRIEGFYPDESEFHLLLASALTVVQLRS